MSDADAIRSDWAAVGDDLRQAMREYPVQPANLPPDNPDLVIPCPDLLESYEQVDPGAAERILARAEDIGKFRRELERLAVEAARDERDGRLKETVFCAVAGMVMGFLLIVTGMPWIGTIGAVASFAMGMAAICRLSKPTQWI